VAVDLSVVICAYDDDRWPLLAAAVDSVRRQSRAAAETIVAVDHNPRLAARAARELPGVVVVENHGHRGLADTRNCGVTAASGSVVAFLDDDAVAQRDWLERLAEPYSDADVLGVGGSIVPDWLAGEPGAFPAEFLWVVGCTYEGMPAERADVRNVIGANMSVRRDVLEQVGGFRSGLGRVGRIPLGCEETELCIRATQASAGGRFVYEPRARVRHAVPGVRTTWRYFCSRCFAEGLSKAQISRFTGARDGLSTERAYVTRTLPLALARAMARVSRGDVAGLGLAARVVAGVAITGAGFAIGAARARA
jgi:GT2 family glycosyltransferase